MRLRTEQKREEIVAVAAKVFRELGYERASMSQIVSRLGGSKATLYGYFASKEELFVAVAQHAAEQQLTETFAELSDDLTDVRRALQRFGQKFVTFLVQPEAVAVQRMVIAHSTETDIGRLFYETCTRKGSLQVSDYLQTYMRKGLLRRANSMVASHHLMALLQSEIMPQRFYGVPTGLTPAKVRMMVARAVDVFMSAYAPKKH